MRFLNLEIKIECHLSFSHSFNNKIIHINVFTYWHRETQYFQLSNIESRLNLAKIFSKFWQIKNKQTNKQKTPQVTSGSIKGAWGICSPPPVRRKKWPKSVIFGKFWDFCPLRIAFFPLNAPHKNKQTNKQTKQNKTKSGAATAGHHGLKFWSLIN